MDERTQYLLAHAGFPQDHDGGWIDSHLFCLCKNAKHLAAVGNVVAFTKVRQPLTIGIILLRSIIQTAQQCVLSCLHDQLTHYICLTVAMEGIDGKNEVFCLCGNLRHAAHGVANTL